MSRQIPRISETGKATVLCIFHYENSPSLRIWPDGGFKCHGCHRGGHISNYPELEFEYNRLRTRLVNPNQLFFAFYNHHSEAAAAAAE